jgi:nucleoside phosphorylase
MNNEISLSNVPLPEDENSVTLDVVSNANQLRQGLPQKQMLEGKITLNPDRCLISYIPPAETLLEAATLTVDRTRYDLYLVDIPFTLYQAPGGKYYTEMTLWIELSDPQHTAFDLCPKNVSTKIEVTKTYVISPQIKFQEAEINLGQAGSQLRFEVLRPTITASGEGQHIFSWTYKGFENQREIVPETKHALFIAQVPHGTASLQGKISYELVIAKKIVREWVLRDCEVEPYAFTWKLDQSQLFYCSDTVDVGSKVAALTRQNYVDVCIVCALAEEAESFINAVQDTCGVQFSKSVDSKKRPYRSVTIQNNAGEALKLHVSWPASYGMLETSLYLPTLLREFNPRIAIMTGICAGNKKNVHLGDIVVADRTFIYDEGKIVRDQQGQPNLLTNINTYPTHPDVLHALRMFDAWKPLVATLGRPLPACHIAPIGSGNAVRGDEPFEQVQRAMRKIVALDMEGVALYRCVADFPGMQALLVKGVCDYGDSYKDDTFHAYAASASALYALAFIKEYVTTHSMPSLSA